MRANLTPEDTQPLLKRARRASPPWSSSPPRRSPSSSSPSPPPPLPFELLHSPPTPTPPLCPRTVPVALAHLRSADPRLAPLIDAHGPQCIERLGATTAAKAAASASAAAAAAAAPATAAFATFASVVQTILAQQLSWKAAATIHRRVLVAARLLPAEEESPKKAPVPWAVDDDGGSDARAAAALRLTPAHVLAMPEAALRGAGVSGAKAAALRDLAQRFADGRLSEELLLGAASAAPDGLNAALRREQQRGEQQQEQGPGAAAAAALLAVRGVGPWSLDMVSMFVLGAPDVLPAGDLGVRKGLARLRGGGGGPGEVAATKKKKGGGKAASLPDADEAARLTAAWRPYRTVGSWLMWRLAE